MKAATRYGLWCAGIAPVAAWAFVAFSQALPRGAWVRYTSEDIWTAVMPPAVLIANALSPLRVRGHDHVLLRVLAYALYLTAYAAAVGFCCGWLFQRTVVRTIQKPNKSVETTRGVGR